MTSEELAVEVDALVRECTSRVLGVGRDQYEQMTAAGTRQAFELDPLRCVVSGVLEEIEDCINHLAMLHIRVRRLGEEANRLAAEC